MAGASGELSIGALSAATGVPAETLRSWERRYGYPVARRKPSGHRVYPLQAVARIQRIAQAIARGNRAAQVVGQPDEVLDSLLEALPPLPGTRRSPGGADRSAAPPLDLVRAFDAEALRHTFQQEWARLGPLEFLEQRAAPLLAAVGEAWAEGQLEVRHEHFASGCLGDFLRTVRLPLEERATGPLALLATLSGELHGVGLQMVAVVCAAAGWQVLILGVDTPAAQVEAVVREVRPAVVALSCVGGSAGAAARGVAALRRKLPTGVPLLVGGSAAPRTPQRGVVVFDDLVALDRWLRQRPR